IFIPDIKYAKDGYPGRSAEKSIISGTLALIDEGYVNPKAIGIQGQSWGGYQVAYLVTRTNMFAAAGAGAPVSNMTSAYDGIRWESGRSRNIQYEKGQSRIGGTLWERPWHYVETSPLFFAPEVEPPLFIMHNDADGAVPWYQGIEYFVALRRLGKPVWMINYNGDSHNLRPASWGNRMDLSHRLEQFFDHFLKGKPAPQWIKEGIPAVKKGETYGY
ncbi:MAG: prolyl oligopeptidase family serine peptidase, partial [Flavobacteriales bacterium]|nr:prolyl oligopeptidase family serine peptidase [Flavobacteriales bacterium]